MPTLSGPQERDLRRTVQQIVDVPLVPLLDDPVPQIVEQLPDVMRFFDFLLPVPEQVIEVPKILLDDVSMRTAVRDTQLAEQLEEVPTIVSYSLLQLIMEQNADIPVPGRGGRNDGLQGFSPEQGSTTLHVSQERISERIMEQIVDFPVFRGGLQDFRPVQVSAASSSVSPGHAGLSPSRLSKYLRSCLSMSLCARPCVFRRWWNSWWKCRRSYLIPLCS